MTAKTRIISTMHYQLGKPLKRYYTRVRIIGSISMGLAILLSSIYGAAYATTTTRQKPGLSPATTSLGQQQHPKAVNTESRNKSSAASRDNNTAAVDIKPPSLAASLNGSSCGALAAAHPELSTSHNTKLRKLAEYETVCGGALASRVSFFVPLPATAAEAVSSANDVAVNLQQFAAAGVQPLVIMEPHTSQGNIDFTAYKNGAYDKILDNYFAALRASNISDSTMGMWVYFPEANIPGWGSVDPAVFASNVTKTVQYQKKYFPASLATVMLDSKSYPSADSWSGGSYVSLLPYVQTIPKGLIDSFGLQGFPWAAPATSAEAPQYSPTVYLPTQLAAEAASSLGTQNIWFNTGTFSKAYANNPSESVIASPTQRQAMLNGVIAQAKLLQSQGFILSVHLFSQNKSATPEAKDWSYWHTGSPLDDNKLVLRQFSSDLQARHIGFWLFDTAFDN